MGAAPGTLQELNEQYLLSKGWEQEANDRNIWWPPGSAKIGLPFRLAEAVALVINRERTAR